MKYEWNFVDALDKASALTTDQMDVENAKRYDIVYTDKEGQKVNPLILHLSPSGAIERVMFALLEKAYFDEKKGKKPMLPVWLSPTQVRLICVSNEKHMKFAEKVADGLEAKGFRVDIDDHDDSIGKRIRNAEKEWTPYIVVIGDDEMKSGDLQVRIRSSGAQEKLNAEKLVGLLEKDTEGMPKKRLPLARNVSKRPIFVG